jgi:hypothetical protein
MLRDRFGRPDVFIVMAGSATPLSRTDQWFPLAAIQNGWLSEV